MPSPTRTVSLATPGWIAAAIALFAGCGEATGIGARRSSLADEARSLTVSRLGSEFGAWGLVRLPLDGRTPVPFAPLRASNLRPAIAPNGDRLAFVSEADTGGVYVADFDGSNPRRVYPSFMVERLTWSPDGTRLLASITLWNTSTGTGELVVIQADGSGADTVTRNVGLDVGVATWSPDGARIAMEVHVSRFRSVLYVVDATGAGARLLFDEPGYSVRDPAWSRDGRSIAIAIEGSGEGTRSGSSIYLIDSSGTGKRRVTRPPDETTTWDLKPQWSPSGGWLALERNNLKCSPTQCLRWDVFAVRVDGSGLTLLSGGDLWGAAFPAW